ncbi:MAG: FKBP-type peptidyl-prolyl cis-trans isomerase [Reichenbachiella sp.]
MTIDNNTVVSITYSLKEADETGAVIQEVNQEEPFVFMFGKNQVLPQFETNLKGKEVGAKFDFSITSDEGYGQEDPQAIVDLPINLFQVEGKLAEMVEVGSFLPMNDQEGNPLQGLVLEIGKETVKMDFNHPMAGMDLHFVGEVIDVREATKEETEHGHVHGPGGHDH